MCGLRWSGCRGRQRLDPDQGEDVRGEARRRRHPPVPAVDAFASAGKDVSGKLSFQVTGHGAIDRPNLHLSAALAEATFFGHALGTSIEPRLEAEVREGVLDGTLTAAGHWTVSARGDLFAETTRLDVAVEADDLRGFAALTRSSSPDHEREFAASAVVVVPGRKGETPEAKITFQKVRLDLPERPGVLWLADPVTVTSARGRLTAGKVELRGEGTSLAIEGMYDTNGSGAADFTIKGSVDARKASISFSRNLALSGRLVADLKALGPPDHVVLAGTLRLEDGRYRLPGLSQIADEIQCVVRFAGGRAQIEGARAKIGGGDVYAAGTVVLDGLKPSDMRLTLQGRRVSFRYPQDLRLMADADLVLTAGSSGNWVRGEVVLLRGVYSKDFELTLASLLERAPVAALQPRDPWRARTSLDVRIVSASGLEVQNNVARLTATVDLVARGTLAEPTLVGQLTLVEGGRITFRNVRYEIETGNILFTAGREFAPVVDLRARAPLRGYDVVVSIAGTWPRLQTSFHVRSAAGRRRRAGHAPFRYATRGSGSTTTVASAASSIVADVVTSPISKGGQKLFKLDRFEIEPVFSGSQVSVRSTVGKQITPNLLVTYSQSLDTAKQPIINVEWRLTDTITLRALRDDTGIIVLDVRRRLRF